MASIHEKEPSFAKGDPVNVWGSIVELAGIRYGLDTDVVEHLYDIVQTPEDIPQAREELQLFLQAETDSN